MARQAREVAPEYHHHLVQRGNNSQHVFLDRKDYLRYLELLEKYSIRYKVKMLAYCLMSNHVHILVIPAAADGLAGMMRAVAGRYSLYFNRKYGKKGRLWESRFYSSVIEADSYLWSVALYIEWNPVRAGVVAAPEFWRYSSAKHHLSGESDPLISEVLFDESDMEAYRKLLREGPDEEQIEEIRRSTRRCRPIGGPGFITLLAQALGIQPRRRVGRPKGSRKQ